MLNKKIIVSETIGVARTGEIVRVGVPFAKGELSGPDGLQVKAPDGEVQPVQTDVLKRWNNGSVKWLLVDFIASVPANGRSVYRLILDEKNNAVFPSAIRIKPGDDLWQVDTGEAVFSIDAREFKPFAQVQAEGRELLKAGACILETYDNTRLTPLIDSVSLETEGPLVAILRLKGRFGSTCKAAPRFSCRLCFFAGSSRVINEFTILNPQPAKHPGGLWDLGDPGSLHFRELAFDLAFAGGLVNEIICSPQQGSPPVSCKTTSGRLTIYQESSGGENWLSPNHRTRNGTVPFTVHGYEVRMDGELVERGKRSTPVIWCGSGVTGIAAVIPRFWQEFPKAFEADESGMKISLFPACFPDLHELQGGEQKTHAIYMDFAASLGGLDWARSPLTVLASPEVYRLSGVFSDLPVAGAADLVDRFISGPDDFIRKRETIDEYGWRNFGDVYADHEAVYHKGTQPFISHYNNQYDICAGLYRKSFVTGDPLWCELASDLSRHVLDIDIYHTDGDREEYSGGLFWHTDHYIDAGLSTHRSFSREHLKKKDPRFCGGGPAAEHCYTTGLMLHYYLSGNPAFRDAVIGLAEWCYRSISGSQTVLAAIKRAQGYLARLRCVNGDAVQHFPRFPLTRGTGNAITACLDAFEAGSDRKFLDRAEKLIQGALHPDDDIDCRDLLNAEAAWSYNVMLGAVAKYLDKKSELGEFDKGYAYARAGLLAYAEWMLLHEYPYLDKPELLEYPNETWVAQELRKSVVLYQAARFAEPHLREAFIKKARFFFSVSSDELQRHPTSGLTRPLALLLQNGWVGSRLEEPEAGATDCTQILPTFGEPTPSLSIVSVASRICGELLQALRNINLKREAAWLRARLG